MFSEHGNMGTNRVFFSVFLQEYYGFCATCHVKLVNFQKLVYFQLLLLRLCMPQIYLKSLTYSLISFYLHSYDVYPRRIQNPVEHLRWVFFFAKIELTGKSRYLFSQNAPSQMFNWGLMTPLPRERSFCSSIAIQLTG